MNPNLRLRLAVWTAVLSLCCVFYFLFVYDISVPSGMGENDRVVNEGKMQNRELGVIVGLVGAYASLPLALTAKFRIGGMPKINIESQ